MVITCPLQLLTSFKVAYYQTPYLSVAKYTIRKLYNHQQFITAYENLLRSEGVTNSNRSVSTKNITGEILSKDALGVTGDKVWIFVKSGKGWHNEEGDVDNKTPYAQENLTVRLSLSGKTAQEAVKIADQLYMMSPDDWATFDYEKGTSKA